MPSTRAIRKASLLTLVLLFAGVAMLVGFLATRSTSLVGKVKPGMTEAEVRAILGKPQSIGSRKDPLEKVIFWKTGGGRHLSPAISFKPFRIRLFTVRPGPSVYFDDRGRVTRVALGHSNKRATELTRTKLVALSISIGFLLFGIGATGCGYQSSAMGRVWRRSYAPEVQQRLRWMGPTLVFCSMISLLLVVVT